MLPLDARLNLQTSFRWVAAGKSITSQNFKLFYRFGENPNPLIGVSIVTAQFKKATLRNRAKRICFDMARKHYHQLPKGLNLVIMPKSQVLEINEILLDKEFIDALSNIKTD